MLKRSLVLVLLLLMVQNLQGREQTFVLQNDGVSNPIASDGFVGKGGGGSNSFVGTALQADGWAWWGFHQSLIKFDLSGLPTGQYTAVGSATLTLYAYSVVDSGDCHVWRLGDVDWNENATMYTYDGVNGWPDYSTSSMSEAGSARIPASQVTQNITGPGSYSWDVTAIVNDWLYSGASNSGFLVGTFSVVGGVPGSNFPDVYFYSSRYGATDAALAPQLEVNLIPEPVTLVLLLSGLAVIGRRQR